MNDQVPAILLVEDDEALQRALSITLRSRGYEVHVAGTAALAQDLVTRRRIDVAIVDLGLPDLDGIELVRRLRSSLTTPILVLSARRDEPSKVMALDAGADDFVTKPFGLDELLARLRAALRRAAGPEEVRVVQTDSLSVDLGRKLVFRVDGAPVHLTPTEWGLVESLVRADGLLVSSDELLHDVWGPGYEGRTNYLRVYMAQLRRKLEIDPGNPRHFITVPGMGYRFVSATAHHD